MYSEKDATTVFATGFEQPQHHTLGTSLDSLGDIGGDGFPDFVAGARHGSNTLAVTISP